MKKIVFAAVVGLALCAIPNTLLAGPPGFYAGGTYISPSASPLALGPTTTTFSSFSSPYGYQTFSSVSETLTPWGWNTSVNSGTYVRPYVNGPANSVYWNPFLNNYVYTYPLGPATGVAYYPRTGVSAATTYIPGRRVR